MPLHKLKSTETLSLPTPILFSCVVEEKPLTATLTAVEANYIQYFYHIHFSDGYSGEFANTESYGWGDSTLNPTYVGAIKNDLHAIGCHNYDTLMFCFPYIQKERKLNVWVLEGDYLLDEVYSVFYNGMHQFTLKREEFELRIVTLNKSILTIGAKEIAAAVIQQLGALKTQKQ